MNMFKKVLSRNRETPEPPSPLLRIVADIDPVFVCDIGEQRGVLRIRRGKWAGRTWAVRLHCCENPLCGCSNVDFHCVDADHEGPEPPDVLHFGLDPYERTMTPDTERTRGRYAADLAESAIAEFSETEWRSLLEFLLTTKREIVRTMDVAKLTLPDSPEAITEDGSLVGFGEQFPFAECFEFDLNGEQWAVDDQYCVMPDCDCRDVVLSFLHLNPSQSSGTVDEPVPAARYDYKRDRVSVEQKSATGEPSLARLVQAVRLAHPSFVDEVRRRHEQLKMLYLRTVLAKGPPDNTFGPGTTVRRDDPKVGRNEPCPCGSGRKYKKCCAR